MSPTHFRRAVLFRPLILLLLAAVHPATRAEDPATRPPGAIWAASPLEIVRSGSNPVDANRAKDLAGKAIACYDGKVDRVPADRRLLGSLSIGGVTLTDGGRTLTLATDPHAIAGDYVLADSPGEPASYDLGGVEVTWFAGEEANDDEPSWRGWLPTLDPTASRKATLGSAPHERWFADMAQVGHLRLDAQARLPAGITKLTIESTAPITECFSGEGEPDNGVEMTESGGSRAVFAITNTAAPLFLSLTVQTGGAAIPTIRAKYSAAGGGENHELTREQLILPWAVVPISSTQKAETPIPNLSGGDPARGKTLFFSDEALCSRCHAHEGKGGTVGPDVKEMRDKSPESLYRSIATPSEEVAPQYVSFTVSLKDGRVVAGVARAKGADALLVTDSDAKETIVPRAEIDEIRPGAASIMPPGLLPVLGEAKVRDIIAFLKNEDKRSDGP